MRRMILTMTLILCGLTVQAQDVQAQDVLAPDPDIEATIEGQITAFRAADLDTAWAFASPTIQRLFQTPQNFGRMVQEGYPMIWDPAEVDFIDLQAFGGVIVQRVQVIDQAGMAHYLGYQMIETDTGWQINGVRFLPAPDVSA
jgi:hypothetical protein